MLGTLQKGLTSRNGFVRKGAAAALRRALDAGYAAEDLHELFARRSRTAVPQGLRYLIDDVARALDQVAAQLAAPAGDLRAHVA